MFCLELEIILVSVKLFLVTSVTCPLLHVTVMIAPVSSVVVVGVSHGGVVVPLEDV